MRISACESLKAPHPLPSHATGAPDVTNMMQCERHARACVSMWVSVRARARETEGARTIFS
jgi:hypothetical protein